MFALPSLTSMRARRAVTTVGLFGAAILVASACSSGSGRSATTAGATNAAPARVAPPPTTAPPTNPPVSIAVGSSSLGPIAVDASGRTLYSYDKDTPGSGTSACNGACAAAWPPALVGSQASAGPGLTGMVGLVTRADGTHQVALNGHPLYRFSGDQGSGDTTGDGFGGIWHVVHTSASPATTNPAPAVAAGTGTSSAPYAASSHPPTTSAPANGSPATINAGSSSPPNTNPAPAVAPGNRPASPPAGAQPPASTTPAKNTRATIAAGSSSLGSIVVDAAGRTLYRYDKDTPGSGTSACNGACATAWPPALVTGTPTAGPGVSGTIGMITRADGTHQITLDGHPLYRFSGDQGPGDTTGNGFGGIWHVVRTSASPASTPPASTPPTPTPPASTPPASTPPTTTPPASSGPWPGY